MAAAANSKIFLSIRSGVLRVANCTGSYTRVSKEMVDIEIFAYILLAVLAVCIILIESKRAANWNINTAIPTALIGSSSV